MVENWVVRLTGRRRETVSVAIAILASLATLGAASPALASIQQELAPFAHCPVNTPGVTACLYSTVTSGEFKIGSQTVPITKEIVLQGGLKEGSQELVGATDGNTLSKTPLTVPGGLAGIEGIGGEVTATAEVAGPVDVNLANADGRGPLVSLPLKIKLDNPLLGPECYIGSNSEPATLHLTDGTTSPPPPNAPISGKFGEKSVTGYGFILGALDNTLVDNAFGAPGVNGCGLLPLLLDPVVDLKAGLPAAPGHNTAIMNGTQSSTEARIVKTEQEIPLFGRCVKVVGVKEGGKLVYHGKYSKPGCVIEAAFGEEPEEPGKYEWSAGPGPKPKFVGSTGASKTTFETVGKTKITCASGSSKGEYTGAKTETISFVFVGCESAALHQTCRSVSAGAGEIRTASLVGELGFINDAEAYTPTVGLDFKPAESGKFVTKVECGGLQALIEGSVIGSVVADKMSALPTLKFTASTGKQAPEQFEGAPKDTLSTTLISGAHETVEQSGLTTKAAISAEEPIEVKARAF